jgi:hypothetical protein
MHENISSDVGKERRRTDPWQTDSIDVLFGGSRRANEEPGSHFVLATQRPEDIPGLSAKAAAGPATR